MKGLGETSHIPLPGLLNLVIISWFMFGHELHNYLLYFKVFFYYPTCLFSQRRRYIFQPVQRR